MSTTQCTPAKIAGDNCHLRYSDCPAQNGHKYNIKDVHGDGCPGKTKCAPFRFESDGEKSKLCDNHKDDALLRSVALGKIINHTLHFSTMLTTSRLGV